MAADGRVRDEGEDASPEAEAAEYVLGTLDPRERRAAEWRLRRDPAFASAVARWSEQLAVLDSGLPPVPPPERVWRGIEAGLKGSGQPAAARPQLRALEGAGDGSDGVARRRRFRTRAEAA